MSVCIDNINFGPEILQSDILEITKFLLNLTVMLLLKTQNRTFLHSYTAQFLAYLCYRCLQFTVHINLPNFTNQFHDGV